MTATARTFESAATANRIEPDVSLARAAVAASLAAATTMTVSMAFLAIAHLAGGPRFGDGTSSAIVDALHTVTILLLLPIPFALHRVLAPAAPRASAAAVALAVDASVFGAVLHALFAAGFASFGDAEPLLLIAYVAFAAWLWTVGSLGSRSGRLPDGRRMALVGATIVGLPVWLAWIGRELDR